MATRGGTNAPHSSRFTPQIRLLILCSVLRRELRLAAIGATTGSSTDPRCYQAAAHALATSANYRESSVWPASLLSAGSSRSAKSSSPRCYNAAAHALRLDAFPPCTCAACTRCYNAAAHALRRSIRDRGRSRCYNAAAHALRPPNVAACLRPTPLRGFRLSLLQRGVVPRCYNAAAHALRLRSRHLRLVRLAATTRQLTLCDFKTSAR